MSGRPGQHLIQGGDFNVSSMLESRSQDRERCWTRTIFTARESIAHCCGRTGLDGDEHLDGRGLRTRAIYTLQLVGPCGSVDTKGLHHVYNEIRNETRANADRSQGGICCSYTENGNEVYDEERCELAWLEARRFLGRVAAETLTDWGRWNVMAPLLLEKAKSNRKIGIQRDVSDRARAQIALLRKRRDGRQLGRTELNWLCQAIWRKKTALKREKHLNNIKESAETEKAPKKTQTKHFNWSSMKKFSQTSSKTSIPRRCHPIRETPLGRTLEKPEDGLHSKIADFAKETGESIE